MNVPLRGVLPTRSGRCPVTRNLLPRLGSGLVIGLQHAGPPALKRLSPKKMDLDWNALEHIEMTSWLLPSNEVFPYSVVIHGSQDLPNSDAWVLAKKIMEHFDMFTGSARVQLQALINPKIVEDGIVADSFHFDDYGNSFCIHFNLEGDGSAHWKIRFVRRGGDYINDYSPCELIRSEQ